MEVIKNRLSVGEIMVVGETMANLDSYIEREIIKYTTLLSLCTDLDMEQYKEEIGVAEFQVLVEQGYIDKLNKEVYNIDKCDLQCKSIIESRNYKLLTELKENANAFIDNVTNTINEASKSALESGSDITSIIDKLKEVAK